VKQSACLVCLLPLLGLVPVHAQLYSVTDLGTLGGSSSSAWGINTGGTIVGVAKITGNTISDAFSYSGGVMTDLGTLGGPGSQAFGINDGGTIVGSSATPSFD